VAVQLYNRATPFLGKKISLKIGLSLFNQKFVEKFGLKLFRKIFWKNVFGLPNQR